MKGEKATEEHIPCRKPETSPEKRPIKESALSLKQKKGGRRRNQQTKGLKVRGAI